METGQEFAGDISVERVVIPDGVTDGKLAVVPAGKQGIESDRRRYRVGKQGVKRCAGTRRCGERIDIIAWLRIEAEGYDRFYGKGFAEIFAETTQVYRFRNRRLRRITEDA